MPLLLLSHKSKVKQLISHQIPLSLALQFFPLFIQNCWLHSKERKRLKSKTNESFEINWLALRNSSCVNIDFSLSSTPMHSPHSHTSEYNQDPHRALGERLLLTAEPGFSGVAAGRGVKTWPPCKVSNDMATLTPGVSALCFFSVCCAASCAFCTNIILLTKWLEDKQTN